MKDPKRKKSTDTAASLLVAVSLAVGGLAAPSMAIAADLLAANPCAARKPRNPCAAKRPGNPCAAKKPVNPCAMKRPRNPCAAKKPRNPCGGRD